MAFVEKVDNTGQICIICSNSLNLTLDLNKDKFQKIDMKNLSIKQQFKIDELKEKLFKNNDMKEKLEQTMIKNKTKSL